VGRFKVDENLPQEAVDLLRQHGHDAVGVLDQQMGGSPDPQVFEVCQQERRALLTLDLGFADLRRYPPVESPGILVLRLANQDTSRVLARLRGAVELLERRSPVGQLWIVEEGRIRQR